MTERQINSNQMLSSGLDSEADLGKMDKVSWKAELKIPTQDKQIEPNDVTNTGVNKFEEFCLKRELLKGIYGKGWEKPLPIQVASIPIALSGKDMLAHAENGAGKTGAHLISVLEQVDSKKKVIQALVLVPTRELALQTSQTCIELAKHMDVGVMLTIGGTNVREDVKRITQNVQVIIATPGRIFDLVKRKAANMDHCRILVLDEANTLLSQIFSEILDKIISGLPRERQILLYSAKLSRKNKQFIEKHLRDPCEINLMELNKKREKPMITETHINSNHTPNSGLDSEADRGKMDDGGWKAELKNPPQDEQIEPNDVTNTGVEKFEEFCLKRELLMGIHEKGWEKPLPFQEASIPIALSGKDMLAHAENGTGKTGAYLISVLEQVDPKKDVIQALVLVPTRELALQTSQTCIELAKHMDVSVMLTIGGTNVREDVKRITQNVQVIIATPGRIFDLMKRKAANMDHCRILILDDADKLLSKDFKEMLDNIISGLPLERQILLYSAKLSQKGKQFMENYSRDLHEINLMKLNERRERPIITETHISSNHTSNPDLDSEADLGKMDDVGWKAKLKILIQDERIEPNDVTNTGVNKFEEFSLKRELLMGIYEKGWEKPLPIQEASIPIALSGKDMLAHAGNGAGKTGAHLISVLEQVDPKKDVIQALVLVPTRELALQTSQTCIELAKHMDVGVMLTIGERNVPSDMKRINQKRQTYERFSFSTESIVDDKNVNNKSNTSSTDQESNSSIPELLDSVCLDEVVADIHNHYVLTGVRLYRLKNTLMFQIQQGELYNGLTVQSTVHWVPPPRKCNKIGRITGGKLTLMLDDVILSGWAAVTGVAFKRYSDLPEDRRRGPEAAELLEKDPFFLLVIGCGLTYNNNVQDSMRIEAWSADFSSQNRTDLINDDMDVPTALMPPLHNQVLSTPGKNYVTFTLTKPKQGLNEHVIPYVDTQCVTDPDNIQFVRGIGLYYKGYEGYGGYIAPSIFVPEYFDCGNSTLGRALKKLSKI